MARLAAVVYNKHGKLCGSEVYRYLPPPKESLLALATLAEALAVDRAAGLSAAAVAPPNMGFMAKGV